VAAAAVCADEIEEIVVTAQKREQSLQDVGISVTAYSGNQLRKLGVTDTRDLAAVTPGLVIAEFGNTPTVSLLTIRGVSQNDFADHNEPPNAVYVDGAYASFVGNIGTQMYDLERVEVLRGPQGTLFGRNSTGGLVQLISRKPGTTPEGYGELTVGSYDQFRFEGAVGGPLASTLLGRLSFATNHQDGFVENRIGDDSGDDEQYNARGQLLWRPSDKVDMLLNVRGSRVDDINAAGYDIHAAAPNFANDGLIELVHPEVSNPACLLYFGIAAPPGQTDCFGFTEPDDDPYTASFDNGNFERDYLGVTATVNWQFDGATLTAITDYQDLNKRYIDDTDSTPFVVAVPRSTQNSDQFSQELRLAGTTDQLRWVVGAYFLSIDGDYLIGLDSELFFISIANAYALETTSEALFSQVEYDLTPEWTITAGFRYTWDQKEYLFRPACSGFGCAFFEFPGTAQVLGLEDEQDDSDWSGRLLLNWRASGDLLLYAGITRGIKAGGYTAPVIGLQTPADLIYGAETLMSYEGGFKWALPAWKTRLHAGVFFYDYEDYQDFDFKNLAQTITNKDAEVIGGEIELMSTLLDGVELLLGVSLLEGEVFDITLPSGRVADRSMPQAPSVSVNGMARREWPFVGGRLALQGDFNYVATRYFRSINHPVYHASEYVVGNARLSWATGDDHWEVTLFVQNVAGAEYPVHAFEDVALNGVVNYTYAKPRWVGGSIRYTW
jgi:iron complex outermembrane receptor protein